MQHISSVLRSQYTASLKMLKLAITACPDSAWHNAADGNRFWHIAYHTLFYVAFYLSPSEEQAVLWDKCRPYYEDLGKLHDVPEYDVNNNIPYSKDELYEFMDFILARLDVAFEEVPLDAPSGFPWISFDKLQLHIYNLRHLQHHTGQLSERIKQLTGKGVAWVGKG
jgi:hypothetical protein